MNDRKDCDSTNQEKRDSYFQEGGDYGQAEIKSRICDEFEKTMLAGRSSQLEELPPRDSKLQEYFQLKDSDICPPMDKKEENKYSAQEIDRKKTHPRRLDPDIWYNEKGESNTGPACFCGPASSLYGIHHDKFEGEPKFPKCDLSKNNSDKLFQYRIKITPDFKITSGSTTVIVHNNKEYIFVGFLLLSHYEITNVPQVPLIKNGVQYSITIEAEEFKGSFNVGELELFDGFLFKELLELVDLNDEMSEQHCRQFHLLPHFVTKSFENGTYNWMMLPMCEVLKYLMRMHIPLKEYTPDNSYDTCRGSLVWNPTKRPSCIRCDLLDRETPRVDMTGYEDGKNDDYKAYPVIVHFGLRPTSLCYSKNENFRQKWRNQCKLHSTMQGLSDPTVEERRMLSKANREMQEAKLSDAVKRDFVAEISSEGFYTTGLNSDVAQFALFIPMLIRHLRFHKSLECFERSIEYAFKDRSLLVMALTHASYKDGFGTNPDHLRNSTDNCGQRLNSTHNRKVGAVGLRAMPQSTAASRAEKRAVKATHNERLEFLGDAVLKLCTTERLMRMFPEMDEGQLSEMRTALVHNNYLISLAEKLGLHKYVLVLHNREICQGLNARKIMADALEALIAAVYLDGGYKAADELIGLALWEQTVYRETWRKGREVPLKQEEPLGDRHYVDSFPVLQNLVTFEHIIGVQFNHIRLLAQALTDGTLEQNLLTQGSGERLEFLGDAVLGLVVSEKLYKMFPYHDEGHLSTLRNPLVNNERLSLVFGDIGLGAFLISAIADYKPTTVKRRADFVESLFGAIFLDKGLVYCEVFIEVTVMHYLEEILQRKEWKDPKTDLQKRCIAMRKLGGGEPDLPVYKVVKCKGPSHDRTFTVSVTFRGKRLATGHGRSIGKAEINAAANALKSTDPFPMAEEKSAPKEIKSVDNVKEKNDILSDGVKFKNNNKNLQIVESFKDHENICTTTQACKQESNKRKRTESEQDNILESFDRTSSMKIPEKHTNRDIYAKSSNTSPVDDTKVLNKNCVNGIERENPKTKQKIEETFSKTELSKESVIINKSDLIPNIPDGIKIENHEKTDELNIEQKETEHISTSNKIIVEVRSENLYNSGQITPFETNIKSDKTETIYGNSQLSSSNTKMEIVHDSKMQPKKAKIRKPTRWDNIHEQKTANITNVSKETINNMPEGINNYKTVIIQSNPEPNKNIYKQAADDDTESDRSDPMSPTSSDQTNAPKVTSWLEDMLRLKQEMIKLKKYDELINRKDDDFWNE